jgi:trehalose-phosphatase
LVFAVPQFSRLVRQIGEDLAGALAGFSGVIVEDKGCSLAVHYRLVGRNNRRRVRAIVHKTVRARGGEQQIKARTGKMVIELRPPLDLDKGTVVSMLIEGEERRWGHGGTAALYIGDDALDEGAFEAITGRGLGVLVGPPGISCAEYRLNDPGDVLALLKALSEMCAESR